MTPKNIVKLSNTIGIISIILLVYWVFIFVCITVFGLKVFRENLTETFYLSVIGILALMLGSLILNLMFNLTRIAEKHNSDKTEALNANSKKLGLIFALSFPMVFGLLFGGDYLTAKKKEKMLVNSAKSIIESNAKKTAKLVNYSFDKQWIIEADDILNLYAKTDKHFPYVSLLVVDSLDHSEVFLGFRNYYGKRNDTIQPLKKEFIQETTSQEREYLRQVFHGGHRDIRFSASDGRYELFYPYSKDGKTIVLYFSDYQQYGKIGS
ncbi:hypothetical protein [Bergeyella sp. RCAD1439]|uniref:hypothetical protein n=1 Tax=Bergeyella anatis TaxID=3113737 RepID=UPI002E1970C1|nr:hypothetical protein [Bergeyella sp. RCAD1439]